jgi:hypothetical protein
MTSIFGATVYVGALLFLAIILLGWDKARCERKRAKLRVDGIYPAEGTETQADIDRLLKLGHRDMAALCYSSVHGVGVYHAQQLLPRPPANLAGANLVVIVAAVVVVPYWITTRRPTLLFGSLLPLLLVNLSLRWQERRRLKSSK